MANTFTMLYYHVVFSTKNREPFITEEYQQRVWMYMGGILREHGMAALCIGGMPDHVHILQTISKNMPVSRAVQLAKGGSSRWIHEEFNDLKGFAWQHGYAAFTVGRSDLDVVKHYILHQREHHKQKPFEREYLHLLRENNIEYDERHVWG